jgi:hypothetical protein
MEVLLLFKICEREETGSVQGYWCFDLAPTSSHFPLSPTDSAVYDQELKHVSNFILGTILFQAAVILRCIK